MIVAFVSSSSQLGGAERSLLDLVASLRRARPDWQLRVLIPAEGPLREHAEQLGAVVSTIHLPAAVARLGDHGAGESANPAWRGRRSGVARQIAAVLPMLRYVIRLRHELRHIAPNVVHTNGLKMHVLASYACPAGVPLVWHIRDFVSSRRLIATALRLHRRRCATAITNSDAVSDDVRNLLEGVPLRRVYNGIDLERFAPTGPILDLDDLADLAPPLEPSVRVGLVATYAKWKGHATFMQALSIIPAALGVRGYVIGGPLYATDGSQHTIEDLERLSAEQGLAGRVGFVGHVDEPAAAIRALDVVVHASTSPEPFGRVIVEAMACGRAVVAADGGGATEILADMPEARYRPGNAAELAERIIALVKSPERRAALGEGGRSVARRLYDRRRLASEVIPIYERVVGGARIGNA